MSSRSRLFRQPCSGAFLGTTSQVQQWQFSENESLKELQSSLSSTCQAVGFQGYSGAGGGGSRADENRISKLKTSQTLLFFIRFCLFVFNLFYINAPLIALRLWLVSRVLKKVHSDYIFISFLITFMGERILGGPCSTMFSGITLLLFMAHLEFVLAGCHVPPCTTHTGKTRVGGGDSRTAHCQGTWAAQCFSSSVGKDPFSVSSFVS